MVGKIIINYLLKRKKYDVAGIKYRVIFIDGSIIDNDCGDIDYEQKLIRINKNLDLKTKFVTLLHELGHAKFWELKYNQSIPEELEHVIIDKDAEMIYDWFFKPFIESD